MAGWRALSPMQRKRSLYGLLFISPWLIGFIAFIAGPMIASLGLSLTDYQMGDRPDFIGLSNYIEALTKDNLFWGSLGRTFHYAVVMVTLGTVGSLALASLLNTHLRGTAFYRTLFFLPHLTPIVASAVLWKWLFSPDFGPVNYVLGWVGIAPQQWFWSTKMAIPSLIIMGLWRDLGGNRMIIFLAGLQGVPEELYEASEIDGAGPWARFLHVTLPMISPTLLFNLILGVIGALKVFAAALVATKGGPDYATWFYSLHIYTTAFQYFEMGYSCALAWLFMIVVVSLTLIQMRLSNRWVFYAGKAA